MQPRAREIFVNTFKLIGATWRQALPIVIGTMIASLVGFLLLYFAIDSVLQGKLWEISSNFGLLGDPIQLEEDLRSIDPQIEPVMIILGSIGVLAVWFVSYLGTVSVAYQCLAQKRGEKLDALPAVELAIIRTPRLIGYALTQLLIASPIIGLMVALAAAEKFGGVIALWLLAALITFILVPFGFQFSLNVLFGPRKVNAYKTTYGAMTGNYLIAWKVFIMFYLTITVAQTGLNAVAQGFQVVNLLLGIGISFVMTPLVMMSNSAALACAHDHFDLPVDQRISGSPNPT